MKQIRHPDTGQTLEEYDEPDPLRDAIQDLLNDRLIEFRGEYRKARPVYHRTRVEKLLAKR
jgi:hypothetical protein